MHIVLSRQAPFIKNAFEGSILTESPLYKLLFQIAASHELADTLLVWFILLYHLPEIDLELGVLLRVMAEEKCFCWLDCISKPSTKVIVINTRLQSFRMQFNENLEQSEIEILLL